MIELIETGAQHLRLTAKAVRILNTIAVGMRPVEFAVVKQCPVDGCHPRLPRLPSGLVNASIERHIAAECGIYRDGSDHHGAGEILFGGK